MSFHVRGQKLKNALSVLLAASIAVVFAGCGQPSQSGLHATELSQWVGKNVKVELRRDALGMSVGQTDRETNGVSTAIVGKLLKIHSVSILVGDERRQIWIPREVILFVEVNP